MNTFLPRYGIQWNGPTQPISTPMAYGYWTPWHLANQVLQHVSALEDALKAVLSVHRFCLYDALNPCWDNRPTDILGRHWGGGKACAACHAKAALAIHTRND